MDATHGAGAGNTVSANDTGLPKDKATSNRSVKAERKGLPVNIVRMVAMTTAVELLGSQRALAEALYIDPRSLRAKLAAERGVSNDDLITAAAALEARAARVAAHAAKLREVAAQ